MVRTVYADLLFLINFSMDFLCFFLVSGLFSRPMSLPRTILASALGGVYAVLSLFLPFHGVLLLLSDAAACAVMCLVAEFRRGMRASRTVTEILVYTGVSMALGGIMTVAYRAMSELGIPEALSGDGDGISAWLFLLLAAVGGGATLLGSRTFRRNAAQKRFSVTVTLCGRTRCFLAAVDTGNALCDPITGCPAAAVAVSALEGFLPRELCENAVKDPVKCFSTLREPYRCRARLLPVRTVTGEGLLLAFRADDCLVASAAPKKREETERRELLLALTAATPEDAEMLLPPGIC